MPAALTFFRELTLEKPAWLLLLAAGGCGRGGGGWGARGQPLPPPQRFAAADSLDTDIGKALALAGGLVDPGAIPRLVLISDGQATAGDALAAAERAAARGVRIDVVPVGLPAGGDNQGGGDVAVDRIEAPDDIRPRAPFDLRLRLPSDPPPPPPPPPERAGHPNPPAAARTADPGA